MSTIVYTYNRRRNAYHCSAAGISKWVKIKEMADEILMSKLQSAGRVEHNAITNELGRRIQNENNKG